jgi:hypothetical protein
MLRKHTILIFALTFISLSVFSQTDNNKFYPGFYAPTLNLTNSLSHFLKLQPLLDSIRKSSKLKDDEYKPLTLSAICVFIDSISSDSISFNRIKITMNNLLNRPQNNYEIDLTKKFKISIYNFNINLTENSQLRSSPSSKSIVIYKRDETDKLENLLIIDQFRDKQKQLWLKFSFTAIRFEAYDNKTKEELTTRTNYVGWTRAESILMANCN